MGKTISTKNGTTTEKHDNGNVVKYPKQNKNNIPVFAKEEIDVESLDRLEIDKLILKGLGYNIKE